MTFPLDDRPRPLSLGHFRPVALNGFGDGRNSYSWSCAWFRNHVYIGTNRNVLAVGKVRQKNAAPTAAYPVPVPPPPQSQEEALRTVALAQFPQIWRYNVKTRVWQRVYRTPLTRGLGGRLVPLGLGFRNMTVFQARHDPKPALYTIPTCGSLGVAPVVLRSYDGEHYEILGSPNLADSNVLGYRGVVPFKGRLFITPVGVRGGDGSTAYNMTVLCTDDPVHSRWEVSNPDGFGNPNNIGIFDMGVCGASLYAGTINTREGCEIWKTDGEGPPPHRWTRVLDRGADRGHLNQAVGCFAEFQGNLYVGTGIINGGRDKASNIGPAASELLRVYPDDTWDLVMGDPRLTRQGLRLPSSGLGPGFDNGFCGYVWRLRVHEGVLYAGTFDSAAYIPFLDKTTWPQPMQRLLDPVLLEHFLKLRGGCELWRSTDGDHWTPVTRNGFGNRYNWGIRALLSTPHGLFVGTANPFGPEVATHGPAGWRYQPNPRGGTEVWHGSWDHASVIGRDESEPYLAGIDPWSESEVDPPYQELAERLPLIQNPFDIPAVVPEHDPERDRLAEIFRNLVSLKDPPQQPRDFAIALVEAEQEQQTRGDPVRRAAAMPPELVGLSEEVADELRAYFGGGLRTVGYWRDDGVGPRQACAQLVAEALALLPAEEFAGPAALLAVAPGAEALAAHLRRTHPAFTVTAVQSAAFPEWSRSTGQERGDRIEQAQPIWDAVLWLEGSSAGERGPVLRKVWHLLRPGGRLIATDLLGSPFDQEERLHRDTDQDRLFHAYEDDLRQTGFEDVRVLDATRETWVRFYRHSQEFFAAKLLLQQLDAPRHAAVLRALPGGETVVAAYVLVSAVRPRDTTETKGEEQCPNP